MDYNPTLLQRLRHLLFFSDPRLPEGGKEFCEQWIFERNRFLAIQVQKGMIGFNLIILIAAYSLANIHHTEILVGHLIIEAYLVGWWLCSKKWPNINAQLTSVGLGMMLNGIYAYICYNNLHHTHNYENILLTACVFFLITTSCIIICPLNFLGSIIVAAMYWFMNYAIWWNVETLRGLIIVDTITISTALTFYSFISFRARHEAVRECIARDLITKAERAIRDQDLALAADIQSAMLPPPKSFHFANHVEIRCLQVKHEQVCGDWTALRTLADGRIIAMVADATGKGVSAALVMQAVQTLWADELAHGEWTSDDIASDSFDPAQWMRRVNHALFKMGVHKPQTLTMGIVELSGQKITYWSAGHVPLQVIANDKGQESVIPLLGKGGIMGMKAKLDLEPVEFTFDRSTQLKILLGSDGVFAKGTRHNSHEIIDLYKNITNSGESAMGQEDDDRTLVILEKNAA